MLPMSDDLYQYILTCFHWPELLLNLSLKRQQIIRIEPYRNYVRWMMHGLNYLNALGACSRIRSYSSSEPIGTCISSKTYGYAWCVPSWSPVQTCACSWQDRRLIVNMGETCIYSSWLQVPSRFVLHNLTVSTYLSGTLFGKRRITGWPLVTD